MTTKNLSHLTTAMTQKNPSRILLALLLAATSTAAFAAKSNQSPLPQKPAALLALAARHNGLADPHLKPWHVKATYQLYNFKGEPTQKGIFQEWWAAPNKYRLSFSTPGHALNIYVTPKGFYMAGDKVLHPYEFQLESLLLKPLPQNLNRKKTRLKRRTQIEGKTKFDCVEVTTLPRSSRALKSSQLYCLTWEKPILAFVASPGEADIYPSVSQFQGRYLANNVAVSESNKPHLKAHLLSADLLTRKDDSVFALPPEAKGHLHPVSNSPDGMPALKGGQKIGGRKPVYPQSAKMNEKHGTVTFRAVIGVDGKLHHLTVISSPAPSLRVSALNAVRTWRYKPYTLGGYPVQVATTIYVFYNMSD